MIGLHPNLLFPDVYATGRSLADVTRRNSDASTALHVAAWSGQLQMSHGSSESRNRCRKKGGFFRMEKMTGKRCLFYFVF